MANKRNLKQMIRFVCGDIAGECIYAKACIDSINDEKMDEIICKIALLQVKTTDKVSVCFDKNVKSFNGDMKAYNKARRDYFKACYTELKKEFHSALEEIVKEMNALLPQEVRDANKAELKK